MEPPHDDDPKVKEHIRYLLYDYVRQHITIDHEVYTFDAAGEILAERLRPISLRSPTDISLPVEPIEALFRLNNIDASTATSPDEKLLLSTETRQYLARCAVALKPPPTRKISWSDDHLQYKYLPHHPLDVLVSRRAQRSTPQTGKFTQKSVIWHPSKLWEEVGIKPVSLQQVEDDVLNQDEILSLRLPLTSDAQKYIRATAKAILPPAPGSLKVPMSMSCLNSGAKAFLECELPRHQPLLRPISLPIFPRKRSRGSNGRPSLIGPEILSELDPKPLEVEEEDVMLESFKMMDGWGAVPDLSPIPSSPTQAAQSSQPNGFLERVWQPSSDDPIDHLFSHKMDEVLIPRTKLLGHLTEDRKAMLQVFNSLDELPVRPLVSVPPPQENTKDDFPASVAGCASKYQLEDDQAAMDLDCDLDTAIAGVYREVKNQAPTDIILRERLSYKESWLMDVPQMPEPLPRKGPTYSDFSPEALIATPNESEDRGPSDPFAVKLGLKKVTGVKSLNISLPWRPFITGVTIAPTLGSIADVEGDLTLDEVDLKYSDATKTVLSRTPVPLEHRLPPIDISQTRNMPLGPESPELLLSRRELKILARAREGSSEVQDGSNPQHAPSRVAPIPEDQGESNAPQLTHSPSSSRLPLDHHALELIATASEEQTTGEREHQSQTSKPPPTTNVASSAPSIRNSPSLSVVKPASSLRTSAQHLVQESQSRSNRTSLRRFLELRGSTLQEGPAAAPEVEMEVDLAENKDCEAEVVINNAIPEELLLHILFRISSDDPRPPPQALHHYIASFDLLQKRGIVRHLVDPCIGAIEVIEREAISDADLIVDTGAAIVFYVLAGLPANAMTLMNRLSSMSFSYDTVLVIFEAYPPARSRAAFTDLPTKWGISETQDATETKQDHVMPYAFSPPVLKAFKQLRRSLAIAESTEAKRAACKVHFVFALTEIEAARYARMFGDMRLKDCVEGNGGGLSGPWDDRSWLVDDIYEGEEDLSSVEGMNLMAALSILSRVNLQSLVEEMTPEDRSTYLADVVGADRITKLNAIIEERRKALEESDTPFETKSSDQNMEWTAPYPNDIDMMDVRYLSPQ